ncbi:C39 family peptidase [Archangium lipolyticum]|uniref:C39 family peptidase n=1 Tax=Archangium lipolyticum TaxID=2970465 RepID=UPI002149DA49|nr:C39 family peptidase [Archangium lipolyticum]
MSLNDILFRYNSTGASAATAKQDKLSPGVKASHQMAKTDLPRLQKYAAEFIAMGKKYGLPPALLAAIASRETRAGAQLDDSGYGSNGADFGLMQVNEHSHVLKGGPYSREHIEQATGILKSFYQAVIKKHPSWPSDQQLRGAVAAYNFGVSNVRSLEGIDQGTANDDYSSDIWARAQALAPLFGGASTTTPLVVSTQTPSQPQPGPKTQTQTGPKTGSPTPKSSSPGSQGEKGTPLVKDLQLLLVKYGYMTEQEMKTGPGLLGPKTRAAVARFLEEKTRITSGKPAGTRTTAGTTPSKDPALTLPMKSVAMIDGVPLYKQGDKDWGKLYLGARENLTIHAAGCAMTSTAMAISKISGRPINPKELDEYLDTHGGYGGDSGNGIMWDVAAQARGLKAKRLSGCSLVTIDKELTSDRPVVAGVHYKAGSAGGANGTDHWVTITGKYTEGGQIRYAAHDPATGEKFSFSVEGNKLRANDDALNNYVTTGEFCAFKAATA